MICYEVPLGEPNRPQLPGQRGKLWVYLPEGDHSPQSLPCVLIAPAGSNLLSGMMLTEEDRPEHLPYVEAGFAVVAYELDGAPADFEAGYEQFRAARAGLVNARNALEYARQQLPEVDPNRIYAAGHSSAGTLALLLAEHEPRLAGCIAYAPCSDLLDNFSSTQLRMLQGVLPKVVDFVVQSSPRTHEERLRCPVFLFHAEDDSVISVAQSRACVERLRGLGKNVTFVTAASGDHYDSMVSEGIPRAIEWLEQQ